MATAMLLLSATASADVPPSCTPFGPYGDYAALVLLVMAGVVVVLIKRRRKS